ncbi:alpha/beta fold hydrolase [Oscillatoria salina]|uniref:alpha/beta fold hydrolase n=1 Tax=Oscillatoria salina TaxID=331517 RepID=UPI0013BA2B2F|nr:alpha/beta hydrolase [Oscillatoria salina]MBZ8178545.1 alpha/beta hydrolase [Oscillatoria salina IIICB1]NET86911.1 alpha/beta hydrolase [Kamptonema sp. SIO1D9]
MVILLRNSRIRLSQGQMFWREVGSGTALVFLHGTYSDSSQWISAIEHLAQEYHCFAPDLLGFGESERPQVHYSIDWQVESLAEYLDALHLQQVILIGHSLGGWIAASYALKYPDRVSGLVLLAPEGVEVAGKKRYWQRWLIGHFSVIFWLLRILSPLAVILGKKNQLRQWFAYYQQILQSPVGYRLLFRRRREEIQAELLQKRLPELQIPILVLQGEKDRLDRIARSQLYAKLASNAKLKYLSYGGRDFPESCSAIVAESIRQFVNFLA